MQFDPNKFTIKAQEALQAASTLASSRQHQQIEPEHLLLAMLEDKSSIAVQIAQKLEAPAETLLAALDREIERIPRVTGASATGQYLSQNLGKVFDVALKEAENLKDDYISSEHLLIAMSEAGLNVSRMLQDSGINRNAILKVLTTIRGTQRVTSQNAEETYNSLKKYSRNLNDQARKGKLDPVIGRDEEIRRVLQILSRRTKNNPVLIGDPGVGKTALVEGIAQRIVAGDVPENLKSKQIAALDIAQLVAGAKVQV